VKSDQSISLFKIVIFYQALPSLLCFYFLWPTMYTWQLGGSLSKVDSEVVENLSKIELQYRTNIKHISQQVVTGYGERICYALECSVSENRTSPVFGDRWGAMQTEHSLYLTISTDIYDIPIILEGMKRIPRTMSMQSMEIHQYDRLAKVIVRYNYFNPKIEEYEWLNSLPLLSPQIDLLKQAARVYLWKEFVQAENARRKSEDQKLKLIRPELGEYLISLRKSKGVLMYRSNKGFTLMPLQ
jgi:hypothetical protein